MNRVFVQALPILAIAVLAACSGSAPNQSLVPQGPVTTTGNGEVPFASANPVRRFCPQATAGTANVSDCYEPTSFQLCSRRKSKATPKPARSVPAIVPTICKRHTLCRL